MRVLLLLVCAAAMAVMPQVANARDGCGAGYHYNGYRCQPTDGGYGRRYEEPYYGHYYGYSRPPTKWEQKGFCPPGQAKKGNC